MLSLRTIASLLFLTLPLAACGAPAEAPVAAPPFDAKAALTAATTGIDAGVYTFSLTTPGQSMSGILNAPGRSVESESKQTVGDLEMTTRALIIGDHQYLKMTAGGAKWAEQRTMIDSLRNSKNPKARKQFTTLSQMYDLMSGDYWMPVDKKRHTGLNIDLTAPDGVGVKALLGHIETATGDATRITGSVDGSDLRGSRTMLGALAKQALPADAGGSVPYAATLADGRLTKLELTMPGEAGTWIVELGDYGTARPAPAPPAAEVKKPSAEVLKLLNSGGAVRGA